MHSTRRKANFSLERSQESEFRIQELQEFRSERIWDSGGYSPEQMPVPDFRIKTLLAYSVTPDS
jgi:hypothetical protein